MDGYTQFEAQAKAMRDQLVAAATAEADRWLSATLAMLAKMPGEMNRVIHDQSH